ncbi:MAG TPA: GNAT family N-acetyltransferase [Solimonas sp.]
MQNPTPSARPVALRDFRGDDLMPIAELFTASIRTLAVGSYSPAQIEAWAPQPPDLAGWRERLQGRTTLIATISSDLAGFLSYEDDGHIDLLYTAPAHARCGVASALYDAVQARLAAVGVAVLFTEASLIAEPFFSRQGFRIVEAQSVTRGGQVFQRYAMAKRLGAQNHDAAPAARR